MENGEPKMLLYIEDYLTRDSIMSLFTLSELEQSVTKVYQQMSATPQYIWPLLCNQLGINVWVKHENHTPTGAFKVRGGITILDWLKRTMPEVKGIVTATRGNHGQSQARAATHFGLTAKILVPFGNSKEKNNAMRAFGGEVIEHGKDFDVAKLEAARIAEAEKLFMVPPFHRELVIGVSSYALELFTNVPDLDVVYVPIGCGSGICSLITVRDLLGLKTEIVGVVSNKAETAKLSFEAGRLIETDSANTFADGVAVRIPVEEAFEIYSKGASRVISVTDDEVAHAMRLYYSTTHNVAEGAGAVPLAGLIKDIDVVKGKNVAVILCGGNIDTELFVSVLQGQTPIVV